MIGMECTLLALDVGASRLSSDFSSFVELNRVVVGESTSFTIEVLLIHHNRF